MLFFLSFDTFGTRAGDHSALGGVGPKAETWWGPTPRTSRRPSLDGQSGMWEHDGTYIIYYIYYIIYILYYI